MRYNTIIYYFNLKLLNSYFLLLYPKVKSNDDISNFSAYPDSDNPAPQIKKTKILS